MPPEENNNPPIGGVPVTEVRQPEQANNIPATETTNPAPNPPQPTNEPWKCAGCEDTCEANDPKCNKCGLCLFCCDAWSCDKCSKAFCGDYSLRCETCGRCKECCSCWVCVKCSRPQPSGQAACSACGFCQNGGCCRCYVCRRCKTRYREQHGNSCRDCGECNNCCQCVGIDRYNPPKITFHKSLPVKEFRKNPSSRFISMEIEISEVEDDKKMDIFNVVKKWQGAIVDDGSLPQSGCEINTAPANGDKFVQQMTELGAALKAQGAKVNNQCGLHVHVDARDFTYYDLRRLLLAYTKIENALFSIVAPERIHSRYCRPCATGYAKNLNRPEQNKDSKKRIISNIYGADLANGQISADFMHNLRNHKYNNARYSALNIHSWYFRGTIECRMHQGSKNPKHIINWGILWAGILDYAMKTPESVIKQLPTGLESLIQMAPNNEVKDWIVERSVKFKKITEARNAGHEPSVYDLSTIPQATTGAVIVAANTRRRAVPPPAAGMFDYDAEDGAVPTVNPNGQIDR